MRAVGVELLRVSGLTAHPRQTGEQDHLARQGWQRGHSSRDLELTDAANDSTELDGGQMNVRFFGNKAENFLCGVSIAPCVQGPSYVFRNLFVHLGDYYTGVGNGVKAGGNISKGKTFIFNNRSPHSIHKVSTFHTITNPVRDIS